MSAEVEVAKLSKSVSESSDDSAAFVALPQKRNYRQRAHSNPIADHCMDYPITPDLIDWSIFYPDYKAETSNGVEFLDIGCGYGGLLVELSPLFPQTLMLGMEIRVKVSDYVMDRVKALRVQHEGQYRNINCIRSNAMKYLPNFFRKGQLSKIFFLFPDPHFKKQKHKWRIISSTLLSEYAYFLRVGGHVYVASDVKELYEWMCKHLQEHPLFEQLPESEVKLDPVVAKFPLTEEGKKVTRNGGDMWNAVFRRIEDPFVREQ